MARRTRLFYPPKLGHFEFDQWAEQLTDQINFLPNFSIISTSDGPESVETGDSGTFGFDVGSSNTTFWMKESGDAGTTGWSSLASTGAVNAVAFAGMRTHQELGELSVGTSRVEMNRWFVSAEVEFNMSSSTTLGWLIADSDGTYGITVQSSFTGSPNVLFDLHIYKNGVDTEYGAFRSADANGVGSFSIAPSWFTAVSGDTFATFVNADAASKKFTNVKGQFSGWKIAN